MFTHSDVDIYSFGYRHLTHSDVRLFITINDEQRPDSPSGALGEVTPHAGDLQDKSQEAGAYIHVIYKKNEPRYVMLTH